jgi:hypothetical protein
VSSSPDARAFCFGASDADIPPTSTSVLFTIPETYTPILLVKKAHILRKETGDDRYWAPLERRSKTAKTVFQDVIAKPFTILFMEPMLAAITVYSECNGLYPCFSSLQDCFILNNSPLLHHTVSFVYGCLYLLFVAYPIVFQQGHGFNAGAGGLMFLALLIGGVLATTTYITMFDPRYKRKVVKHAPNGVPPEARLEMTLLVAPLFAISFFWVSRTRT